MRSPLVILLLTLSILGFIFQPQRATSATITLTTDTHIGPGDTSYENQDIVVDGARLTVDNTHDFNSLSLINGATVACSDEGNTPTLRLELRLATNLTIDASSSIDVTGLGWGSESGPGAGSHNETSVIGSGGGHGGFGSWNNSKNVRGLAYGSAENPTTYGSGGGGADGEGGRGGGVILLNIGGTLNNEGIIAANGGNPNTGGGGAGGSIQITASTITGLGMIQADGSARGHNYSGGGAGGRILINTDTNPIPCSVSAFGKRGYFSSEYGAPGTIMVHQISAGTSSLIIHNNSHPGTTTPFPSLSTPPHLLISEGAQVETQIPVETLSTWIGANGILTHPQIGPALEVNATGDIIVEPDGQITAKGKGYTKEQGPGAGSSTEGSNLGSGAGHGGLGTVSNSIKTLGSSYGSFITPTDFGSGGGGDEGRSGGGSIQLHAGATLRVDGIISANGDDSYSEAGGGGSGGSIQIHTTRLSGSGTISTNGSSRGHDYSGGGGGGRIALYQDAYEFTGTVSAYGKRGYSEYGGAGTIYTKNTSAPIGTLFIDNNEITDCIQTPLDEDALYDLVVRAGGIAETQRPLTLKSLEVGRLGVLTHPKEGPKLQINASGDVLVEETGTISVDGKGFGGGSGPGAGSETPSSVIGSGGGYGGNGGEDKNHDAGGVSYGHPADPVELGSGGGGEGRSGGGSVYIETPGTIRIEGIISSNGGTDGSGGGGSGGSVQLRSTSILGNGSISANGSNKGHNYSGGGGGGRIALFTDDIGTTISQNLSVNQGSSCYDDASPGTVGIYTMTRPFIRSHTPSDTLNTPVNQMEITWGGIIDPATFTITDIALSNPAGDPILVTNLTQSTQNEWTIEFLQQTGEGIYTVQIGPNVSDASGELMDQDGDETGGEDPDDIYQSTFEIDTTPPEVLEITPTGDVFAPIESISVTFSEVIKDDTCLVADIQLSGPSGSIPINTIKWLDKENWALIIDSQSQEGTYTVTIPTCVEDIAGNAMTSSFQDTFQIKLPDLQPHSFNHPAEKRVQESFDVTWITDNIGAGDVSSAWRSVVHLSDDDVFDTSDTRLRTQWLSTNLTVGSSIDSEVSVTLPLVDSGDYFLLLNVNDDISLTESSTANNFIASPIKVRGFDYTVSVQTDTEVGFESEPILLYGDARYDTDNSPATGEPARIHVRVRGKNRYLDVVPDSQGEFETTFNPVPGEAGRYTVRASHPVVLNQAPVQDTFSLLAMVIQPNKLKYRIVPGTPTTTSLTLKNVSEDPLTDFSHTLFSAPDNLQIDVDFPDEIAARDEETIQVSMLATDATIEHDTLNVIFHSSEGTSDTLRLTLDILPEFPRLDCTPAFLRSGMVRSEQTIVECELTNNGGVPAYQIHIALPDVPWLSLASPENYAQIQPGESVPLTFLLQPLESTILGQYTGNMVIESSNATNIQLPFQFNCISDAVGDLVVDVVDELTYFTDEAPHVADARIVVKNALGEIVTEGATNVDGIATFIGLRSGLHEVQVHADAHSSVRRNTYIQPGIENPTTIFVTRQFVTYIWRVIETEIEDRYRIVVETVFETFVPGPVVTISPKLVDLGEMTGGSMQVNFRLENIGLIQAEDVRLHSYASSRYEIDLLTEEIGILAAHQSVVVPATITDTEYDASGKGAQKGLDCSMRMGTFVTYAYECGDDQRYHLNEAKYKFPTVECSGQLAHGDPSFYGAAGEYGDGQEPGPAVIFPVASEEIELPMTCDLCEQAIIDNLTSCLRGYLPLDCLPAILNNGYDVYSSGASASSLGGAAGGIFFSCLKDVPTGVGEAWNTFWCIYNIYHACDDIPLSAKLASKGGLIGIPLFFPPPAWHGSLSDEMEALMERLAQHAIRLEIAIEPWNYFLGSQSWFECPELDDIALAGEVGYDMFTNYVNESSDGGYLVTPDEVSELMQNHELPACADMNGLVTRWNNSVENYEMGVVNSTDYDPDMHDDFIALDIMLDKLEDAIDAIEESQAEGNSSIFNSVHQTMIDMVTSLSNQPQGVCAQVRIRIEQEAVLTRSAFIASLDISNNSDTESIQGVSVELVVTDSNGTTTTLAFGIAEPELTNLSAVDGTGTIGPNETGRARWTMVPTRDAAPTEPTPYFIGGTLTYIANDYINEIPLYPDTIWVYPDPILQLDYFHERYAYSDDPFTLDIVEPAIPYSLGLLVHNEGAGEAQNLSIESSQPQIIDNDKGLLVNFQIIGSQVGTQEVDRSLTVNLGNIPSGNTVGARWLLTSSLQGEFHSFSATFEHLNPIGDANISLFDSVDIHEMVHVVRVQSPDDDLQPDFLVNEILDVEGMPDTIYTSQNFLLPVNPAVNIATDGNVSTNHKIVTLNGDVPTGWVYFKLNDPAGDGEQWHLDRVLRSDGREVLLDWNAWSTHRVVRNLLVQREDTLHLLDHDSTGKYTLYYNTDLPDVITSLWMLK